MDSAVAIGFRGGASFPWLNPLPSATAPPPPRSSHYFSSDRAATRRPNFSSSSCASVSGVPRSHRRFLACAPNEPLGSIFGEWVYRKRIYRKMGGCAVLGHSGYHPSEEIGEPAPREGGEDARLSDAETARTLIEVNSKATLMFSGLIDDEVQQNIILPDLPYLTDEHGDIYFAVKEDEDILQTLIADDKLVQVIVGLDNIEMLAEMGVSGPSNFDFSLEDISNEDSDTDDDYDEDVVGITDDEEDDMISSETLSEWANSETLNSSHPMYFAGKIAEVVSKIYFDWMEQPSASIVIQGLLRPAFIEEQTFAREYPSAGNTSNDERHHLGEVVQDNTEDLDKDHALFYKLEMINIQLLSSYGNQDVVKVQDFRKARPDVLAHSTVNIISRLKAGGDVTTQALKSLCWRHKGIQVEDAVLAGVDSLGFDVRVCSGTQVQTLRFAFNIRATSELSAEKQLRDLLFPRLQHKQQKCQQAYLQKE